MKSDSLSNVELHLLHKTGSPLVSLLVDINIYLSIASLL